MEGNNTVRRFEASVRISLVLRYSFSSAGQLLSSVIWSLFAPAMYTEVV